MAAGRISWPWPEARNSACLHVTRRFCASMSLYCTKGCKHQCALALTVSHDMLQLRAASQQHHSTYNTEEITGYKIQNPLFDIHDHHNNQKVKHLRVYVANNRGSDARSILMEMHDYHAFAESELHVTCHLCRLDSSGRTRRMFSRCHLC
jgi:hypothetical protein